MDAYRNDDLDDREPETRIRATCPDCGEVELTPPQVELRLGRLGRRGLYRFTCPSCTLLVTKAADRRIVRLLASAGVKATLPSAGPGTGADREQLPAEALEPHHGPPLTWDDLLDFHFELQAPGWWARFLAACR
ncbi:MAG TPA: hypothetical protein VF995_08905 [Actinomycetota bacterium]